VKTMGIKRLLSLRTSIFKKKEVKKIKKATASMVPENVKLKITASEEASNRKANKRHAHNKMVRKQKQKERKSEVSK
jgi:regulator of replication initiation timing